MFDAAQRKSSAPPCSSGAQFDPLSGQLLRTPGGVSKQGSEELAAFAAALEALKLERLVLKYSLDEMCISNPDAEVHDESYQRRFDEITEATLGLAEAAVLKPARNIEQLRAKAAFVLEFVDPTEASIADRLIWSFVTEFIVFAAALSRQGSDVSELD